MRLPNLDVSLLAVHYLFSAAGGTPGAPAPRPGQPSRRQSTGLATASRRHANAPVQASLDVALEHAARAGLPDCRDAGRRGCVPVSAPRDRRERRRPARHVDPTDRAIASSTTPASASTPASTSASTPASTPASHDAALVPAAWADMWDHLPVYQRADLARAVVRSRRAGVPIEESLTAVEAQGNARTRRWLSRAIDVSSQNSTPLVGHPGADAGEVDLYWALDASRQETLEDGARTAERFATHAATLALTDKGEYFYQANRLADRFDLDWLRGEPRSDLTLLRAVHAVLLAQFPDYRAPLLDPHAIAVALQLRRRCETRLDDDEIAIEVATFTREIDAEIAAETLAARLIPIGDAPPAQGRAWFDGIAVRDALGKTPADLARDLARLAPDLVDLVEKQPSRTEYEMLHPFYGRHEPIDRQRLFEIWVRKRLGDLLESVRFPFGTPAQSIDTILLRLSGAHGMRRSPGDDFATVMRDFNRLCAAWRATPGYWISPTLAASIHLAHATGDQATLLASAAGERETLAIDRFHARLAAYAGPPQDAQARAREWQRLHPPPAAANQAGALPRPERIIQAAPPRAPHAARKLLEELLMLPRWTMHIGEMIMRGDSQEILGMLPFIVPAYDIEEGIRHGNQTRALRGAFQFGADVLMTWIGGRVSASLAMPESLPLAGNDERAMLGMLHRSLETLGDERAVSLPLTESGVVEPPRAAMTLLDTDMPLRYRSLALRARGGEIVPLVLPNVPRAALIHLSCENRVIPVGASGDVVWELDWDGHIVGAIGAARLGNVKRAVLEGLRPATARIGQAGTVDDDMTVTSMMRWLDAPSPPSRPGGASSTDYAETALKRLMDFDEDDDAALSVFQELGRAHRCSETFRLLTHQALPRRNGEPLRLDIHAGAVPAYSPDRHVITLPPARELAEIEYLGETGSVHFDARDVWIHEFIHAATQLSDPSPALATAHRGPVVYLTDRILYEINRPAPERIAYASSTPYVHQRLAPDLRLLAERVVRENLLIDRLLARRTAVSPDTLVGGTPVAQRTTVVVAQRIESVVRAAVGRTGARTPFLQRLFDRLHANTVFAGEQSSAHLRLVRHFVEHARLIYDGNTWARGFLDAWLDRDVTTQWTIHRLSRILANREGVPCRVDTEAHRIELSFAESFAYLGPTGVQPYTMQRRVATILAELGLPPRTRTPLSGFDIDTERGALVYIENKLLGVADDNEARRVAARICRVPSSTPSSTPPSTDTPVNPTLARRAADDEDRYLASVCVRQPDDTCVCS